jgi:hypothetical protein
MIKDGEEEKEYDNTNQFAEELAEIRPKPAQKDPSVSATMSL